MKWPRILVMTPVYKAKDYCLTEFLENAAKLDYPNYHHVLIDNSKDEDYYLELQERLIDSPVEVLRVERGATTREALTRAQNLGRKLVLEGDYDYMFSLESDIFPPKEALKKLVMWGYDVVTGAYLIGQPGMKLPCATVFEYKEELGVLGTRLVGKKENPDGTSYLDEDELNEFCKPGLKRVAAGGMGCALIHRRVLEQLAFMFEPGLKGHSDIYFFNDCARRRIPVYVDTHIWCYHDNSDWDLVEDR